MIWRLPVLALFVVIMPEAVPAGGMEATVYVYEDAVAEMVDVNAFEQTGDVTFLDGFGDSCLTEPGPAPDPYPQIRFLGPCFEQLGNSNTAIDGISFTTHGSHTYWKKNTQVFVLWKIHIPSAHLRAAADFEQDITMSMWVDWDQNETWDRDELVVRKTVSLRHYLPTGKDDVYLYYLTTFRTPDISRTVPVNTGSGKDHNKELAYLWVRGSLSYDNPVVSPDGDQLYGEFEDYRVGYRVNSNKNHTNKDDN